MQYRILFVFFLLVLMACGQAGKVPDGVLSREKMRDVLLDMVMADAYSNENSEPTKPLSDSIRKQRVKLYYKQILDMHHLTQAQWQKSYDWYEGRPDRLKQVYDDMMEIATANREDLDKAMRIKTYMEDPYAVFAFGNNVLFLRRPLPVPYIKELIIPAPHKPELPKPAPPKPVETNKQPVPVPMGTSAPNIRDLQKLRERKLTPLDTSKEGPMGRHKPDFKPKQ